MDITRLFADINFDPITVSQVTWLEKEIIYATDLNMNGFCTKSDRGTLI